MVESRFVLCYAVEPFHGGPCPALQFGPGLKDFGFGFDRFGFVRRAERSFLIHFRSPIPERPMFMLSNRRLNAATSGRPEEAAAFTTSTRPGCDFSAIRED